MGSCATRNRRGRVLSEKGPGQALLQAVSWRFAQFCLKHLLYTQCVRLMSLMDRYYKGIVRQVIGCFFRLPLAHSSHQAYDHLPKTGRLSLARQKRASRSKLGPRHSLRGAENDGLGRAVVAVPDTWSAKRCAKGPVAAMATSARAMRSNCPYKMPEKAGERLIFFLSLSLYQ